MSNLTNNTAELNKILAAVNALPEAGEGGINPTGTIEITENGTHDVTNYATAEVNVPSKEPVLQEGSATPTKSQQTINPPSGVDGFSKFLIEKIPDQYIIPTGTAEITENGEHDVTGYARVDVNVPDIPAVVEPLTVTENGTWEPGTGVDGFSKVVVNVPDIPSVVQPLEVTENGTYTVPAGVDGYSPVTVNVPSEDLTAEIEAQAALIEEQAGQIEELLTVLDGKAAGGGESKTVTITSGEMYVPLYYFLEDGSQVVLSSFSSAEVTGGMLIAPEDSLGFVCDKEYFKIKVGLNGAIYYLPNGGEVSFL